MGGSWEAKEKGWLINLSNKQKLIMEFKKKNDNIKIRDVPDLALRVIRPIVDKIDIGYKG